MTQPALALRPLTALDLPALQRVLEGAPGYAMRVGGAPPGPDEAHDTLTALPPDVEASAKVVFGVFEGEAMVGCADVIRGWPAPDVAFIGLLLLAEAHQGRGLGRLAYDRVEAAIRAWPGCRRIRLGVVEANAQALPFWRACGFAATGERKPFENGAVRSEVVLMEKRLEMEKPL